MIKKQIFVIIRRSTPFSPRSLDVINHFFIIPFLVKPGGQRSNSSRVVVGKITQFSQPLTWKGIAMSIRFKPGGFYVPYQGCFLLKNNAFEIVLISRKQIKAKRPIKLLQQRAVKPLREKDNRRA